MTRQPMAPVAGLTRATALPSPPPRPTRTSTPSTVEAIAGPVRAAPVRDARSPAAKTRPRSEEAATMRAVTLSLPVQLIQEVRSRAKREGTSQPDVLMDALVATQERLTELLGRDGNAPATRSDGLFTRHAGTASTSEDPLGTLTVRMLSTNVRVIDDLVQAHDAPSRSALCASALRDYLG